MNQIFKTLITTKPEVDPLDYIWKVNNAIYSVAVAWKNSTATPKQQKQQHNSMKTLKPKWQQKFEYENGILRKKISQITEELRRLTTNGRMTRKLARNRKWMKKELKKITKNE